LLAYELVFTSCLLVFVLFLGGIIFDVGVSELATLEKPTPKPAGALG
jgi:hypothetical protein